MIQRSKDTRFILKSTESIRITGELRTQELERDVASQLRIVRPINHAHAPAPSDART